MQRSEKDKETRNWLEIAKRDLEAGRKLASTPDFSSQASFFSQQSAEKALKGFLLWHQERFKKDHDLRYLGDLALIRNISGYRPCPATQSLTLSKKDCSAFPIS